MTIFQRGFGFKIKYDPVELLLQRVALALVVFLGLIRLEVFNSQPSPIGLAWRFDLTFIHDPALTPWFTAALLLSLLLYIWGRATLLALSYLLAYWVVVHTLSHSQGAIGHGTNLVGLVLLALWSGHGTALVYRLLRQPLRPGTDLNAHDLANYFTMQVIAAAYIVAGISKLILSKGTWIDQLPNIAVAVQRNHDQRYYNDLTPGLMEKGRFLADLIAQHPTATRLLFSGGLLVELLAFLALLNRRAAFLVGVSLYVMHVLIEQTMALNFYRNKWILLIYFINLPFIAVWCWRGLKARRAAATTPPAE